MSPPRSKRRRRNRGGRWRAASEQTKHGTVGTRAQKICKVVRITSRLGLRAPSNLQELRFVQDLPRAVVAARRRWDLVDQVGQVDLQLHEVHEGRDQVAERTADEARGSDHMRTVRGCLWQEEERTEEEQYTANHRQAGDRIVSVQHGDDAAEGELRHFSDEFGRSIRQLGCFQSLGIRQIDMRRRQAGGAGQDFSGLDAWLHDDCMCVT